MWVLVCLLAADASPAALIARARALAREGDADAADELLRAASTLLPLSPQPLLLRGNLEAFARRRPEAALRLYAASLALHPTYEAHYFSGAAHAARGAWDAALAAYDAAAALEPSRLAPRLAAAEALLRVEGIDAAREALQRAAEIDPRAAAPLVARARVEATAGGGGGAVAAYRELTERLPYEAKHMAELAALLVAQPEEARRPATPNATPTPPCPLPLPEAAAYPGAPTAADAAAAALALDPTTSLPPAVRALLPSPPPPPTPSASAAAASLPRGPCALLRHHPSLAPFAREAEGGVCEVSLPAGETTRLHSRQPRGVLVPPGATLRLVGRGATLDAGGASRHFVVAEGGVLQLRGVTLTGGRAMLSSGGAVFLLPGATLEATDVTFSRNRAVFGSGGAVASRGAAVLAERCAFLDNEATFRGGALSATSLPSAAATLRLRGVSFDGNGAARGAADVQLRSVAVEGEAEGAEVAAEGEGEGVEEEGAAEALPEGVRQLCVECVVEGLELQEGPQLGGAALRLLREAARADVRCPAAFSALSTFLYTHAFDEEAAAAAAAFAAVRPDEPLAAQFEATRSHASARALHLRAQTLNKEVAALRKGNPSTTPFSNKTAAQDAATTAFLLSLRLSPSDGDVWHDLGTSLFFAGEKAEADRVYAAGLAAAPQHAALRREARLAALFPAAPDEAQSAVAAFPAAAFRRVQLPEGSFSAAAEADVAAGEEAFGGAPAAFVSAAPLLSREECADAIAAAERWAERRGGWTTSRHYSVPTTDVPLSELDSVLPWFNAALHRTLLPALASRYPHVAPLVAKLCVLDCFLVKYSAAAQNQLPTHADQSLLSFTISLNDPSEYEGGGTWFSALGAAVDAPAAGHVIMFPGRVEHGGHPITAGTRYVIVLFMGYSANRSGRPEGYVLEQLEQLRAEARGGEAKDEL
ncbi:hypothetical protein AB1Y20_012290 [Prymnesium parvum]|uniref:Fe2OG dioxygenase domain-containing protein n=1 Tax=Prymnesium parvum TaxID=97485 RepID=A0AB34IQG1_PRYPA